jgi:hypothetical protein
MTDLPPREIPLEFWASFDHIWKYEHFAATWDAELKKENVLFWARVSHANRVTGYHHDLALHAV